MKLINLKFGVFAATFFILLPVEISIYNFSKDYASTTNTPRYQKQKRKGLLINAYYRSGSSFTGNLFNYRRNTFYLFEPLVAFKDNCEAESEISAMRYLHDLFHCRFHDHTEILKMPGNTGFDCINRNICFRQKSRLLCLHPFCEHDSKEVECFKCGRVNIALATQYCLNAEIVVIKTIRLCSLKSLNNILEDNTLDVKVLHLARDPRGILSSRDEIGVDDALHTKHEVRSIRSTCQRVVAGLQYVSSTHEFDNKYKLVRYEDICIQPVEYAEKIYRFAGLRMTNSMMKLIAKYTKLKDHHQDETNKDDAKIEQEVHSIQKRISFSIKPLHSNTNWWKWLLTLSVERVIETQNVCRHMMKVMGYTEIQTIKDIEPASLIKSFCPNQNITFC